MLTTPQTHLVFVYGSLKGGLGNAAYLLNSPFIGLYTTDERDFGMHDTGVGYPVVNRVDKEGRGVVGEVYAINTATLLALDKLEGHPSYYKRERVCVTAIPSVVKKPEKLEAWMYIYPYEYEPFPQPKVRRDIKDGCEFFTWRKDLTT